MFLYGLHALWKCGYSGRLHPQRAGESPSESHRQLMSLKSREQLESCQKVLSQIHQFHINVM